MQNQKICLYENKEYPYVDAYLLNSVGDSLAYMDKSRGAVIVVPGGGYEMTSDREAEPVAMKFAAAGYHTFILWYRVKPEKYTDPLEDLARTVALIRSHAEKWRVDPDDITLCGFSAGGHLAASLGVFWDKPFLSDIMGTAPESYRPNRLILSYPVITSGPMAHRGSFVNLSGGDESVWPLFSLENQVSKTTPPTFLWHTANDPAVPVENSLLFATSLSAYNIPFELHIFPDGPHGLSVAEEFTSAGNPAMCAPDCAIWAPMAVRWLKK